LEEHIASIFRAEEDQHQYLCCFKNVKSHISSDLFSAEYKGSMFGLCLITLFSRIASDGRMISDGAMKKVWNEVVVVRV
jgi:hypothetical protein